MNGTLIFKDGTHIEGTSFGAPKSTNGEIVFSTGMVGYPESFTDPSFAGQILVLTYPLIGNYGVPPRKLWESGRLQISGLIVSNYIDTPSHFESVKTLAQWLKKANIPALEIADTRMLTQKIRQHGSMLGKIVIGTDIPFADPNLENLVAKVSTKKIFTVGQSDSSTRSRNRKKVMLIDCGAKNNIARNIASRGVEVTIVPWNHNPFTTSRHPAVTMDQYDGLIISNGPGDPKMADITISTVQRALEEKIPMLGVCLGNQILALAAGGDTYKLKYGHRSQNQPCTMVGSNKCYITTQNHGFAVSDDMPKNFKSWFVNANDNSNEGIIHTKLPIMSVQFHPEAYPGPIDTEWIFDYFLEKI